VTAAASPASAMKIELKYQISHGGIVYPSGVHDLPETLLNHFLAKFPWVAVTLTKIELKHPINHNGIEYPRGVHELTQGTAQMFLRTAPHAAVPVIERESARGVKGAVVSCLDRTDQAKSSDIKQTAETIDLKRIKNWQDLEISFLSEYRLQVRSGEVLNYAELGFADSRGGNGKPNSAWLLFRTLAESEGEIMIAKSDPKRSQVEKQVQQIRSRLRKHFGISGDPLPFTKDKTHVGYRAEFKISCSLSYQK
jgi:hypothetical protein